MKKYIAERNAHEAAARSGSGDTDTLSNPATKILVEEGMGTPSEDVTQDGVDN